MAYFNGVKVGDRVWSINYGWGEVQEVGNDYFKVYFEGINNDWYFMYNGFRADCDINQTLFWDEIKFKVPKKPNIELSEVEYRIDLINEELYETKTAMNENFNYAMHRNDKETAEKALKIIKKFSKLLALRDQECPDSRGYEFTKGEPNWYIYRKENYYLISSYSFYTPDKIYFKTKEDAQRICDILNEERFSLEE